jgi:nucleoside-diphosphate-sugar epimerase
MAFHLVTGGSGFVGSNIARLLSGRGEAVRVLDIWRDGSMSSDIEFHHADINDRDAVARAMKGVDYVHHTVALVPLSKAGRRFWTVNVEGTRVALQEATRARVKMFCHMSSSAVFGSPSVMPITNSTPLLPVERYGRAKLAAEQLVYQAGRDGLPVSVIRPRTIVGPGRLGIFEILFEWIRDGANILVIGSGDHLFQFVHADDLAEVSIQSCLQEKRGTFNAGAEKFGTLREDIGALIRHAGVESKIRSVPPWLAISLLTVLDKLRVSPLGPWHYLTYHKPYYFDIGPVKEALGWQPRYTNNDILAASYDWFVARRTVNGGNGATSFHRAPVKQGVLHLVKKLV